MRKSIVWLMPVLIFGWIASGCSPKARYERRLDNELAGGVRNDSLFMGIYLGMPQMDFYTHCWKLNRKGLIKQGPDNTKVEYILKNELKYPGTMYFYPLFYQGKICEMPVQFMYNGWAPWNKKLSSDHLLTDVLNWYKKTYGGGFMKVKHSKWGTAYIKVTGNRRITIFKQDDQHVWVIFTDMLIKKELNDTTSGKGKIHEDITKDLKK